MNSGFSRPHTLFVQRNFVADFFFLLSWGMGKCDLSSLPPESIAKRARGKVENRAHEFFLMCC